MAFDAWAASTAYTVGDKVTNDTEDYICTYAHTSETDGDFEPGTGDHWALAWNIYDAPIEAQWGLGTKLKRGDGEATESFTTVAKVNNISGPSLSLDTEDTTDHDSDGGWEEIIPTILRSGEITLDISFLPTNNSQLVLIEDMVDRVKSNYKMIFPDTSSTTWEFSAYVTGFESEEPTEGPLNASVTLKITGEPTIASVNDS